MSDYHIVAFYKEDKAEISSHAEAISRMYGLPLRYEKLPSLPSAISLLVGADTVFCILNCTIFGFRRLMRYAYALEQPVVLVHPSDSLEVFRYLKVLVGYLQENKEKVVWANFLQRHHPDSPIELIVSQEKDENIATMVQNNVTFIEQVLQMSKVSYTKRLLTGSLEKNLKDLFGRSDSGLLLVMRPSRIFSFYLPFPLRLFRKYARTPMMLIPKNDSLYVPCH
ncbi:MAG: hypothetical protein K2I90_01815 [Odoribacter sp.]|nr:hypothetical protein [Odoribacter sp.]